MMRTIVALLACLFFALPAQAEGYHSFGRSIRGAWGGLPTSSCLYGSAYADGCSGANQSSVFKTSAYGVPFNTYATSASYIGSGQSWHAAHQQPWNVAGVDYPVGYYTPKASLLNPHTSPPAGCGYNAAGGIGMGGGAYIRCVMSGSVNIDIEGYDFSVENGIQLIISGSTTGTVTIKNNNFACGSALCAATPAQGLLYVFNGTSAASFYIGYNVFDGGGEPGSTSCGGLPCTQDTDRAIQIYNSTGSRTFEYNAFLYFTGRDVGGNSMGAYNVIFRYNYFEGIQSQYAVADHGEIYEEVSPTASTIPLEDYLYNTILISKNSPYNLGTALIYMSTGGAAVTFTQIDVIGNTLISNGTVSLQNTFSTILETAQTITTLNTYQNYIDPSYVLTNQCFRYFGTIGTSSVGSGGVPDQGGTQNANLVTGGIINSTWATGTGTSSC